MTTTKSRAEELADHLDRYSPPGMSTEFAAELRRLSAIEQERDRLAAECEGLKRALHELQRQVINTSPSAEAVNDSAMRESGKGGE